MSETGAAREPGMDFAERIGDHGARIAALENAQHRDRQETNAQMREIRETLSRIEGRERGGGANGTLEVLIGRLLDVMQKPVPPAPPQADLITAVVQAVGGPKKSSDPLAVLGYVIGSAAIAWIVRGVLIG